MCSTAVKNKRVTEIKETELNEVSFVMLRTLYSEQIRSSGTLVTTFKTTRNHNPENNIRYLHRHDNLNFLRQGFSTCQDLGPHSTFLTDSLVPGL
jgi:hypothetical protein